MDTCPDCGKDYCVCPYVEHLNTFEANWEKYRLSFGWLCPKCKRGLAPLVTVCPCVTVSDERIYPDIELPKVVID